MYNFFLQKLHKLLYLIKQENFHQLFFLSFKNITLSINVILVPHFPLTRNTNGNIITNTDDINLPPKFEILIIILLK